MRDELNLIRQVEEYGGKLSIIVQPVDNLGNTIPLNELQPLEVDLSYLINNLSTDRIIAVNRVVHHQDGSYELWPVNEASDGDNEMILWWDFEIGRTSYFTESEHGGRVAKGYGMSGWSTQEWSGIEPINMEECYRVRAKIVSPLENKYLSSSIATIKHSKPAMGLDIVVEKISLGSQGEQNHIRLLGY